MQYHNQVFMINFKSIVLMYYTMQIVKEKNKHTKLKYKKVLPMKC